MPHADMALSTAQMRKAHIFEATTNNKVGPISTNEIHNALTVCTKSPRTAEPPEVRTQSIYYPTNHTSPASLSGIRQHTHSSLHDSDQPATHVLDYVCR